MGYFSIIEVLKVLCELPQRKPKECLRADGLQAIYNYVLNRIRHTPNASSLDLNIFINDAIILYPQVVVRYFGGSRERCITFLKNKFTNKVQTVFFNGEKGEYKGFNILS